MHDLVHAHEGEVEREHVHRRARARLYVSLRQHGYRLEVDAQAPEVRPDFRARVDEDREHVAGEEHEADPEKSADR